MQIHFGCKKDQFIERSNEEYELTKGENCRSFSHVEPKTKEIELSHDIRFTPLPWEKEILFSGKKAPIPADVVA